uniref:Glutathione peroxidase n=1 Tax=Paralichthys olivaceus TaxID=8255 RepID=A7UP15_PAROL|nr:glutathione peroxidase [Paralichthys olivaceus]
MNELHSRYSSKGLVILGVPCNQFGHQENCKNEEILRCLKYVRPGNGFEPKFQLLEKVDVNGKDAHPLFVYLKNSLPFPSDDTMALMSDPKFITWSPVSRNDVSWNFEKFLIGPDGEPYKRYSRNFLTIDIEADIKDLLQKVK